MQNVHSIINNIQNILLIIERKNDFMVLFFRKKRERENIEIIVLKKISETEQTEETLLIFQFFSCYLFNSRIKL